MASVSDILLLGIVAWFVFGGGSAILSTVVGTTRYDVGTAYEGQQVSSICSGEVNDRASWLRFIAQQSGMESEDYKQVSAVDEGVASALLSRVKQEKC
jgi:hypothetical protein